VKLPAIDAEKEASELFDCEAKGSRLASDHDRPLGPEIGAPGMSDVKATASDGCEACSVSEAPSPNTLSVKLPDR